MREPRHEMRVVYLSERSDLFGGGQMSLCDLVQALRGTHVRPLVILPGRGPLSETLDRRNAEWTVQPIPPLSAGAGSAAVSTLLRLRRLVRDRGIDLLHSDTPRTALYAGLTARLTGRRHVFHLRASKAPAAVDRLLLALSDRVVAVSRAAASRNRALENSAKTTVVPTGLSPIDFLPRPEARLRLDLPQNTFVIGIVGRVEEDKGRDEAVAALASIRRLVPGALLVFLGPVDMQDAWTRTCALRAAASGMAGAVRLAGAHRDAARLMKAFDVLLHPSRHEALPRTVIEALFAEVPVVATSVGGVPEIIDAEQQGCLVPPRDPEALARAVVRLGQDPMLRTRLTRAGLARARECFTIERMTAGILRVYDELVPSRPESAWPGASRPATAKTTHEASR